MRRNLLLLMAFAICPSALQADVVQKWNCEYLATNKVKEHHPLRADLILYRHHSNMDASGDRWEVVGRGKSSMQAQSYKEDIGSVGGSSAFRWTGPDGHDHRGYLAYSDMLTSDGAQMAWFGLDQPSVWQYPGFFCRKSPSISR